MSFLIQDANAETTATTTAAAPGAAPQQNADMLGAIFPFIIVFVAIYFLIMRPQQRKFKLHQAMVAGIQRGDKVVTSGGILGKVTQVDEKDGVIQVEIAEGVKVKVVASTISTIIGDKPVNDNSVDKAANKKKA